MNRVIFKYKYQVIIMLLILFNLCVVLKNQENYLLTDNVILTKNDEKKLELNDEHSYKALVYYPNSKYKILNKEISINIKKYVDEFKKNIKNVDVQKNQYYTLDITYDEYKYNNYLSYVFYIDDYIGGAHPNRRIWTISYDIKNGNIITIDDLIKKNPDFLEKLSTIIRKELLSNAKISNTSMLLEGTKAVKENFTKFAFGKKSFLVFFQPYQVSSYSSGSFVVEVSYSKIFE